MSAPVPPPSPGVRRSRDDAVLGCVCAGIARSAGLDPLLLRIAVVVVTVLTGGAGLLAYLAAWVLIPRDPAPTVRPAPALSDGAPQHDVRDAWRTAGNDLRSLAGNLRTRPAGTAPPATDPATPTTPGAEGEPATVDAVTDAGPTPNTGNGDGAAAGPAEKGRSPLAAADDAATALGERLRDPEVKEGARRAVNSVSQAVSASVDEVGRRVRRDKG
jgi:phage shock protein PspC (stress-responsive transcriptional regulator)